MDRTEQPGDRPVQISSRKDQIRELRSQGLSYDKISTAMDIDKSYIWRVCTGKDIRRPRKRLADARATAFPVAETLTRMASVTLGGITEAQIAVKLLLLSFDVWRPFLDRQRSDLGVQVQGRLVRIQAKTASYDERSDRYRAALTTKKKGVVIAYDDNEFEFFIVKCNGIEEYYVIPSSVGNKIGYANLYPHRERIMDRASLEQYRNGFDLLSGGR